MCLTEYHANQGKHDELADYQEGEVTSNDSAIETGVRQGALVLAEPPHHTRQKYCEEA